MHTYYPNLFQLILHYLKSITFTNSTLFSKLPSYATTPKSPMHLMKLPPRETDEDRDTNTTAKNTLQAYPAITERLYQKANKITHSNSEV